MIKPILSICAAILISSNCMASQSSDYNVVSAETIEQNTTSSANNTSTSAVKAAIDLSTPVDYERCQQTQDLAKFLDSIPKNDAKSLAQLKKFLVGCRELLTERISNTQEEISKLQQRQE